MLKTRRVDNFVPKAVYGIVAVMAIVLLTIGSETQSQSQLPNAEETLRLRRRLSDDNDEAILATAIGLWNAGGLIMLCYGGAEMYNSADMGILFGIGLTMLLITVACYVGSNQGVPQAIGAFAIVSTFGVGMTLQVSGGTELASGGGLAFKGALFLIASVVALTWVVSLADRPLATGCVGVFGTAIGSSILAWVVSNGAVEAQWFLGASVGTAAGTLILILLVPWVLKSLQGDHMGFRCGMYVGVLGSAVLAIGISTVPADAAVEAVGNASGAAWFFCISFTAAVFFCKFFMMGKYADVFNLHNKNLEGVAKTTPVGAYVVLGSITLSAAMGAIHIGTGESAFALNAFGITGVLTIFVVVYVFIRFYNRGKDENGFVGQGTFTTFNIIYGFVGTSSAVTACFHSSPVALGVVWGATTCLIVPYIVMLWMTKRDGGGKVMDTNGKLLLVGIGCACAMVGIMPAIKAAGGDIFTNEGFSAGWLFLLLLLPLTIAFVRGFSCAGGKNFLKPK